MDIYKKYIDVSRILYYIGIKGGVYMVEIHPLVYPIFSLLAGILILIFPAILNYVVAFYLIIMGIMGIIKM